MTGLHVKLIEFSGADRVERTDEAKHNYTIYRKATSSFAFRAFLNRPMEPRTEDDWQYSPYPGFSYEYYVPGDMYKSFWSPESWSHISVTSGEVEITICCELNRTMEGEKSFYARFKIITEPLSAEERAACTHPSSRTSEGECWGGGSGSCTVEIITSCTVCGATLRQSFDHRD